MKDTKSVPEVVARRLPRYYRYLDDLLKKQIYRISSNELSKKMGVTASQVRQDFNFFGGFGQQGYGYNVEMLHKEIGTILGLYSGRKTIIIGAGYLGHALANHTNFKKRGFTLIGAFDIDKEKIGTNIGEVQVYDYANLTKFIVDNKPEIAILAVPRIAVRKVAKDLISMGIKALWNFSYIELEDEDDVVIENVHLSDSLMMLSYKLNELE
ncbi:MAG: redox-sensing transcriptional repressor Rex [Ruminococcaceae bacterium]|nr:redox-sensing transcriptional repressor Rex [Oscillospiraceae bacterium]